MIYSVTIKAFDHVSTHQFEAASEDEARSKALERIGFSIQAKPQPYFEPDESDIAAMADKDFR